MNELQRIQEEMREQHRWVASGLGALNVAGMLGLLQVTEMTTTLRVAAVAFAVGLAGAIGFLLVVDARERAGSYGTVEFLMAVFGFGIGAVAVMLHLAELAAIAFFGALVVHLIVDAIQGRAARKSDVHHSQPS